MHMFNVSTLYRGGGGGGYYKKMLIRMTNCEKPDQKKSDLGLRYLTLYSIITPFDAFEILCI